MLDYFFDVLLVSRAGGLIDRLLEFLVVEEILVTAVSADVTVHVVVFDFLDVVGVNLDAALRRLVLLP